MSAKAKPAEAARSAKPAAKVDKAAKVEKAKPVAERAPVAKSAVPVKATPAAVVKGKPGRKPKAQTDEMASSDGADAVPEASDDTVDPSVQVVEKLSTKKSAKDRRAKEKALKEALERSYHGTEEDLEARRNKLKALIKLGKERGFLTYAEINDHLPESLVDAEAIDQVVSTFGDMGIQIFDQAPDAETLLMNPTSPAAAEERRRRRRAGRSPRLSGGACRVRPHPPILVHGHARALASVELLTRWKRDIQRERSASVAPAHGDGDLRLPDDDRRDPGAWRQDPQRRDVDRRGGRRPGR
ncbi:MAG: RNA polymerase sigma factor region1.1 domain-containing protein [Burkholderiaceae bacterium]|nr:RNA polymerase sigma factor region1.1 domain-containing protein [Burkholderiaceae bacterium]